MKGKGIILCWGLNLKINNMQKIVKFIYRNVFVITVTLYLR